MNPIKTDPLYSFSVPRPVLLAIQLFQSSDPTRFALNCVKFEITKGIKPHSLMLVATDGRRLGTYEMEIMPDTLLFGEIPDSAEFSIDLTGAKKLPKTTGPAGKSVSVAVFEKHVEISCGKFTYCGTMVEEKFPNWRAILPAEEIKPTPEIMLNFDFLGSFAKAAKILTGKPHLALGFHGQESVVDVRFGGDRAFRGIVMPMRDSDKETKA